MADAEGSPEPSDHDKAQEEHGRPPDGPTSEHEPEDTGEDGEEPQDEEDEEGEEDEEPRLKYATLTRNVSTLYRKGDASSIFLVAGDKMIVGTHNGNIHVLSLPSLQSMRVYHAHSASVSAISISPFPPPLATGRVDAAQRLVADVAEDGQKDPSASPGAKNSPRQVPIPRTPSNDIHIATSSIDGNVCIASLVDAKYQLRNFGRPVQAVALSPDYKSDRNYLSGGQAGTLVLTTGGQAGKSTNATTTGTAAAASGWLGSMGLGSNTGTDKVLHSGEGIISTIKWSLTGKYVLWVNEHGIKIMRSHLHLESAESANEWKRLSHISRPKRPEWEEMAGVWRARAEWIDRDNLDSEDVVSQTPVTPANGDSSKPAPSTAKRGKVEEVIVGWGDTIWIIKIHPRGPQSGKNSEENKLGHPEIATIIRFDDCTVSGVSLYTPNLLLVLVYLEKKESSRAKKATEGSKKGRSHRNNALEPELRLVDINTQEEVDSDTLSISRFETLSSADYHLGVLPPSRIPAHLAQRGYLGTLGSGVNVIGSGIGTVGSGLYTGVETVGQGVWDATMYGPRMLGANRLFNSGDSVRSSKVGQDKTGSMKGNSYLTGWIPGLGLGSGGPANEELNDVGASQGMKIFIFSPYDCIVAVKRNLADRLQWLNKMHLYQQSWQLIDEHPEAAGSMSEPSGASSPPTPSKASSIARSSPMGSPPFRPHQQATLADFFADSTSVTSSTKAKEKFSAAEKEKRRVGELWLQQLVTANKWSEAGEVAGKVLNTTSRWEHWIWTFLKGKRFDEISPVVPTYQITPPLPSMLFEVILGHYVSEDRARFKTLLDLWPSDLFEITSITTAINDQLESESVTRDSVDWQILQECLAKLLLAEGQYKEALRCYIRLQDADTAMSMIRDHHLVEAIADDIPSFVLLRIPPSALKTASTPELEELSSDSIKLLVDEATHGVVEPEEVVTQLQNSSLTLFVLFYLRALWRGEGSHHKPNAVRVSHRAAATSLAADEGKVLVENFADTAVELFAEYDRDLLMDFLQNSTAYTFEKAVKICERKHYINELVYLLSKTGEMKKALFLIINELQDVSAAIAFAKEQDDKGLWDDLLDYSMSRPRFISGLLAEVGTAIDPITLVKRIPSGLEIEGLKDGLKKMIREYDLQHSISSGVADVLSSEVAVGMETLRRGRRKGIKFDVASSRKKPAASEAVEGAKDNADAAKPETEPGHCVKCQKTFVPDETETLISFACGHAYHVSHLLSNSGNQTNLSAASERVGEDEEDVSSTTFTRTIGPKVTNARLLKDKIEAIGGCRLCKAERLLVEPV